MRLLGKRAFNRAADEVLEIKRFSEWIIYNLRSIFHAIRNRPGLAFGGRLWKSGGRAMFRKTPVFLKRLTGQFFRFVRTQRGTTAIEFALIAPPFVATLIAIFEVTIFLFGQMALQNAANQAARYFLTGQAENGNWSATTVVGKVCPVLFNCTKLFIVVQDYASFAAANTSAPAMYDASGNMLSQPQYTYMAGSPNQIMVLQLVYAWPVVPGPLGFDLGPVQNGAVEMMGVSAFRVEPYTG
jgi:Flp pilus assembly protein TadG